MLRLASETDPVWVARALADLDTVLVDHAHCEKKAASSALGMVFAWPERAGWMAPLSELAREELAHFELVLRVLSRRGVAFYRQVPSEYGARLNRACRKGPERVLDKLLCAALVEARSCERMQLLAAGLAESEPELSAMFSGLLASEARHHQLFVDLAKDAFPDDVVSARLAELARHEAMILKEPCAAVRMHSH
jgi:tRNA 2-(methylsulfanyl)-N6-isopentenyladenosine37 hydroxylase